MAQQTNGPGQGWQYSGGSGSNRNRRPPKKGFNLGEWIPIIVLFCIPSGVTQLIAFVWAAMKILEARNTPRSRKIYDQARTAANQMGEDVRQAADHLRREVNNARGTAQQKAQAEGGAQAQPHAAQTGSTQEKASRMTGKKPRSGMGLTIAGAILSGIFGIATAATTTEFLESMSMGYFFGDELTAVIACALFLAGGVTMLLSGLGKNRRKERFLNYLAYIGANREVDLAPMAAAFGVSVRKLCKDLRKMLSDGVLPTGYLDLAAGKLFLSEMGYRAPAPEPEEKPREEKRQDDDILREIRQVNDDIPDEVMSAKIDRIEEITGKILAYQKAHPEKAGQLRSFLNYYLPTTLKILRAYAQLDAQGIEGENISAAKARIEGMMDQVVAGFEKQLDKLFQDDAMDISSDVQVLENMLKKDGLSGDQNMTMTL